MAGEAAEHRFEYYTPRQPYWSYDGLPFGSIYALALAVLVALVNHKGSAQWEHLLVFVAPASLHVLLFLATQWSVDVRCFVRFRQEPKLEKATHVKITPLPSKEGQQNKKVLLNPIEQQDDEISVQYLKKKFAFNRDRGHFERISYDINSPLGQYVASAGLSKEEVARRKKRYGQNVYDIPLPTFGELFQEHAVAPFFVFQLFCVLLWLMDEYWYYSLLTLFMLIVLEAQMVHRRLHDLGELRAMRIPPRPVNVLRDGAWKVAQTTELLPGDIIAICRSPEVSFPCDALLLQGNVLVNEAMLTGESVPQMKVSAALPSGGGEGPCLDMTGLHKQHIVSAGTNVMMHQNTEKARGNFKKVPTVGSSTAAVGYVLRTGFDTTQGELCRTILFSADRVTVTSREAGYFILILLAFAIVACIYVLYDGLVLAATRPDEPPRSTFKLILAVSHIITSVVPPEFPIMLSLAVNLSLVALVQKRIFCTEPFRVPLAGKIQTCCFDKTGTLTSDSMEVGGVHGLPDFPAPAIAPAVDEKEDVMTQPAALQQSLPFLATAVMTACNGLTLVESEIVGDPLEKAALQAVRWLMIGPDLLTSKPSKGSDRLQILRRFPFASELQRMAVLVRHQGPGLGYLQEQGSAARQELNRVLALVKGSCEALKPRLVDVPADLDSLQDELTKAGFRVLCLAAKEWSQKDSSTLDPETVDREDVERDLQFCGLLVLRNAVKANTSSTIRHLRKSYHRVVMITGDHPLTACQVATNVCMSDGTFLVLEKKVDEEALEWRSWEHQAKQARPFVGSREELVALSKKYTLCVPGSSLALLSETEFLQVAETATVFARVSPQQKERIVLAMNQNSHTMMLGDGTNDVGALKSAHVGVSLLTSAQSPVTAYAQARARNNGQITREVMDQAPIVRLGDASIASPFTHKGESIKCGLNVLRCGRATLCSVLMMYKIMGLNSILSAFAMSALTLDGVKLGDSQTAVESIFTSMCFFLVSRSSPAKQLAKQQPISSVFAWPVMLTLAVQLVIHVFVLYSGWQLSTSHRSKDFKRDLEGEFEPNLTNTVVFLLMASMHASSFLANYDGHPFMQPLSANKPLMYSLLLFVAIIVACAAEVIPDLNSSMSLVLSPNEEFRQRILLLVVADMGLSLLSARAINWLAVVQRGRAAERQAKALGLGLREDEPKTPKEKKKSKAGKTKATSTASED
eukprot:TRINITY_DN27558_c0_g1_i1.p1 TRINITY_DN27558_c0_g1~~TRINITY_DN27558_c0_g1_i1.p1  ORF type:complete len:1200 (+),score=249.31 TRINITY_DN27558_c0_g1_i1:136-3735(+)